MTDSNAIELQSFVDSRSEEERQYLRRYLAYLDQSRDPENGVELDRAWEAMQGGDRVSLDEVKRQHEALTAEGK